MTDITDDDWSTRTLVVLKSETSIGRDTSNGRVYLMAYSPEDGNPGGKVCNLFHGSGSALCRLPVGHTEPHMSFDVTLVVASGIYVDAIGPDPDAPIG